MGNVNRLYNKAKNSPNNFKFNELCKLAEHVGFTKRNTSGSHLIYKSKNPNGMMNFQPDDKDKSKAKPYQIKQLLRFIDENELI
jgi:predicted RNA binding protein YcfA (HicA-like mRNA interferase family)